MKKPSVKTFIASSLSLAALLYFLILPLMMIFTPTAIPSGFRFEYKKDRFAVDIPQWYFGAERVRKGEWNLLYPEINRKLFDGPNCFRPWYPTGLFHPESASKNRAFHPSVSYRREFMFAHYFPMEWIARYPREFWSKQQPGIRNSAFNYFFPPPTALVMAPVAWFSLEVMGHYLWPILTSFSMFGILFFGSRIYRFLSGGPSYTEGFLILGGLFFLLGDDFVCGNVSPMLGVFLAWGVYAWMRGKEVQSGFALIPPLLTKGIPVFWLPYLLIGKKIRWKTILTLAGLTLAVNAGVFCSAGWTVGLELYRRFFFEIMPTLTTVIGVDYLALIANYYGIYPGWFYGTVKYLLLGALFLGFFLRVRADGTEKPAVIASALIGPMAVFLIFNRVIWPHYFTYLFLFPFLGWMVWEYRFSTGIHKILALCALILGIPAAFTVKWPFLGASLGVPEFWGFFYTPVAVFGPEWLVWKYFIPGIRFCALVPILAVAFCRLYPVSTLERVRPPWTRWSKVLVWTVCLLLFAGYSVTAAALRFQIRSLAREISVKVESGDLPGAVVLIEKAARRGSLSAQFSLGGAYAEGAGVKVDMDKAAYWFRFAAMHEYSKAEFALAYLYETGKGVPKDLGAAFRWYVRAMAHGEAGAPEELERLMPCVPGMTPLTDTAKERKDEALKKLLDD